MSSMDYKYAAPDVDGLKDYWQTPPHIFSAAHTRFGFTLDAAATRENSLCGFCITEDMNALTTPWRGRVFANPPYSRIADFTARMVEQSSRTEVIVALVPANTDTQWWHQNVYAAAAEIWFYTGRLQFISPATGQPKAGNKGGSCLVVYRPSWGSTRFGTLSHKTGLPVHPKDAAFWAANSMRLDGRHAVGGGLRAPDA